MSNVKQHWYVYLLRCADNSLYCGITTDITRRLSEHNHSNKLGAKYTRVRRPVVIAYHEPCQSRQQACRREYQVKRLSKVKKEALVANFTSRTHDKE